MTRRILIKGFVIFTFCFLVPGALLLYNNINPPIIDNLTTSYSSADIKLSDLEEYSTVIVKVKVIDERGKLERFLNLRVFKETHSPYTLTQVEVEKVYKGEDILNDYIKNNVIKIAEDYQLHKTSPFFTKQIAAFWNYRPLKEGKEYILFLRVFELEKGYKVFAQPYQLSTDFLISEKTKNIDEYNKLTYKDFGIGNKFTPDMLEQYKSLAKEVHKKYK